MKSVEEGLDDQEMAVHDMDFIGDYLLLGEMFHCVLQCQCAGTSRYQISGMTYCNLKQQDPP